MALLVLALESVDVPFLATWMLPSATMMTESQLGNLGRQRGRRVGPVDVSLELLGARMSRLVSLKTLLVTIANMTQFS